MTACHVTADVRADPIMHPYADGEQTEHHDSTNIGERRWLRLCATPILRVLVNQAAPTCTHTRVW